MSIPYGSQQADPTIRYGAQDWRSPNEAAPQAPTQAFPAAPPPGGQAGYSYGAPGQAYATPPAWGYVAAVQGDPGTLDLPWYGIGFLPAVKRAYAKCFRFDGRASLGEYWWFYLFMALGTVVGYLVVFGVQAVAYETGGSGALTAVLAILTLALVIALLWTLIALIAVGVRRLHDAGYSGAMYLVAFIPMIGSILLLVFLASRSTPEGARYDRGVPRW